LKSVIKKYKLLISLAFVFSLALPLFQNFSVVSNDGETIHLTYSYDKSENTTYVTDRVNSGFNKSFTYDGLSRVTSARFPNYASLSPRPSNGGGSITYSKRGDILTHYELGVDRHSQSYNSRQQLTSSTNPSKSYTYDSRGRLTADSLRKMTYRYNDDMIKLVTNNATINYLYDDGGMRIKKVITPKNGTSHTTYYMYSGNNLMFEASSGAGKNNISKEYIYSNGNLVATRNVKTEAGCVSNCSPAIDYTYFHFDPLRSTVAVSDDYGNLTRERYNIYGSPIDLEDSQNSEINKKTDVRFAGHVTDDESGLIYMGARYYDPSLGRFISVDPIGFKGSNIQSFNRYAYANNNPNKFIDPDGKMAVQVFLYNKATDTLTANPKLTPFQYYPALLEKAHAGGRLILGEGFGELRQGIHRALATHGSKNHIVAMDAEASGGLIPDGKGKWNVGGYSLSHSSRADADAIADAGKSAGYKVSNVTGGRISAGALKTASLEIANAASRRASRAALPLAIIAGGYQAYSLYEDPSAQNFQDFIAANSGWILQHIENLREYRKRQMLLGISGGK
jgi:RHS repeat-associated protein